MAVLVLAILEGVLVLAILEGVAVASREFLASGAKGAGAELF